MNAQSKFNAFALLMETHVNEWLLTRYGKEGGENLVRNRGRGNTQSRFAMGGTLVRKRNGRKSRTRLVMGRCTMLAWIIRSRGKVKGKGKRNGKMEGRRNRNGRQEAVVMRKEDSKVERRGKAKGKRGSEKAKKAKCATKAAKDLTSASEALEELLSAIGKTKPKSGVKTLKITHVSQIRAMFLLRNEYKVDLGCVLLCGSSSRAPMYNAIVQEAERLEVDVEFLENEAK